MQADVGANRRQQAGYALAGDRRGGDTEDSLRGGIAAVDGALLIERQQAVGDVVHDGANARLALLSIRPAADGLMKQPRSLERHSRIVRQRLEQQQLVVAEAVGLERVSASPRYERSGWRQAGNRAWDCSRHEMFATASTPLHRDLAAMEDMDGPW